MTWLIKSKLIHNQSCRLCLKYSKRCLKIWKMEVNMRFGLKVLSIVWLLKIKNKLYVMINRLLKGLVQIRKKNGPIKFLF